MPTINKISGKLTPLMQQYWDIKSIHMDKILMFRMGDFYEMFHDDAIIAAPILNIALTSRNKKSADETPMCGIPHHSIAGPINKLLAAGHKVAICDQMEDPQFAKTIVKRAVTRILSPGMVYDPDTLDHQATNYLASFGDDCLAFLEPTTGDFFYYRVSNVQQRNRLLTILAPKELVISESQKHDFLTDYALSGPCHSYHEISETIAALYSGYPTCAIRLISYAVHMQGQETMQLIQNLQEKKLTNRLELGPTVLRHLEILQTYKGEKKGALFFAINRTKTAGGARLLRHWLCFPLTDINDISNRLEIVSAWANQADALTAIRRELSGMGDGERRLGKISTPNCNPRDLVALADTLTQGLKVTSLSQQISPELWQNLNTNLLVTESLINSICSTLIDDPPLSARNGYFIRQGFSAELDELIMLTTDTQTTLNNMEMAERTATNIPSLKIRYNSVFGYYIEITHTHKDKVPPHYQRKQTLTQAERYTTPALTDLEAKILSAKTRRAEIEHAIFLKLRNEVLAAGNQISHLCRKWNELDLFTSLAWLAIEQNYIKPKLVTDGAIQITASRHPVVEQTTKKSFVPNSITVPAHHCLLITGPNMAGKSTLMRQVAVTAIMAQIGSFVPATSATLPIFEQIFTRIGASDYLAEGLSTFMVEMQETADMLHNATPKSLVILDEIGRGTSTYDGMSLAQAILEYLIAKCRAITLFATHYHELTNLEILYPAIINCHMAITERKNNIDFLYALTSGSANKSYGIQVAELAKLPNEVTKRAYAILHQIENTGLNKSGQLSLLDINSNKQKTTHTTNARNEPSIPTTNANSEPPIPTAYQNILTELKETAIQKITPLDALNKIATWQESVHKTI